MPDDPVTPSEVLEEIELFVEFFDILSSQRNPNPREKDLVNEIKHFLSDPSLDELGRLNQISVAFKNYLKSEKLPKRLGPFQSDFIKKAREFNVQLDEYIEQFSHDLKRHTQAKQACLDSDVGLNQRPERTLAVMEDISLFVESWDETPSHRRKATEAEKHLVDEIRTYLLNGTLNQEALLTEISGAFETFFKHETRSLLGRFSLFQSEFVKEARRFMTQLAPYAKRAPDPEVTQIAAIISPFIRYIRNINLESLPTVEQAFLRDFERAHQAATVPRINGQKMRALVQMINNFQPTYRSGGPSIAPQLIELTARLPKLGFGTAPRSTRSEGPEQGPR